MNLSKFFIDRPIFAGVLSLLILIAGLVALRGLPIELIGAGVMAMAFSGFNGMFGQ